MKTRVATFPLRLPVSLKTALQALAERDGTSLNQFLVVAAAEKLAAMHSEEFFRVHRERSDEGEFLRLLNRDGGEPPRPEDVLVESHEPSSVG